MKRLHDAFNVKLRPTPTAIRLWNKADGAVIGLFHVTYSRNLECKNFDSESWSKLNREEAALQLAGAK